MIDQPTLFDGQPVIPPEDLEGVGEDVERIHEAFEGTVGEYLDGARAVLYAEAQKRGEVSTDDYWRLVEAGRIPPMPEGTSPNCLGGLFSQDDRFRAAGWTRSEREGAHGNLLREWTIA